MTPSLAEHTTLQVGGPARHWITARTADDVVDAVGNSDSAGVPVLLLGGGSNVVVSDAGFPGTVVEIATQGIVSAAAGDTVLVSAAAGEPWDALVAQCVARGWVGVEALSGIPGRVGATPIQNVGAYGQDVGQVVESVVALDRRTGAVRTLTVDECGFGYRSSAFKDDRDRWVVLEVAFRLGTSGRGPVTYGELARSLGVEVGDAVDVGVVRQAVLALRRAKGMVLDASDPDTRSVGSFFMNPIVAEDVAATVAAECPRYPATGGIKLSAAWLIDQSGVGRGFRVRPDARAAVSSKHSLALTNAGGASASDVIDLARAVRERVRASFGITLQPEARLVNCAL